MSKKIIMAKHNELGQEGERLARELLEQKDYRILLTNWRHGRAELDIIAQTGSTLVFVEVKTRTSDAFGQPDEFVSPKKEILLAGAACAYMEQVNFQGEIRFDIISVLLPTHGRQQIRHIEDAFFPGIGS